MVERLLTPSKITAWLGCGHYLSLRNQVDSGLLSPRSTPLGEFAELLIDKGNQHESSCLDDYEAMGKTIYEVPGRNANETFAQWVDRVSGSLDTGFDVIYQMPFHSRRYARHRRLSRARGGVTRIRPLRTGGREADAQQSEARTRDAVVLLLRGHRRLDREPSAPHAHLAGLGKHGVAHGRGVLALLAPLAPPTRRDPRRGRHGPDDATATVRKLRVLRVPRSLSIAVAQ